MFAGVCVPEANGVEVVVAPTCECLSIWAECDAVDIIDMSCECFLMFAGVCVPEADGAIVTPTREGAPIWAECHAIDANLIRCEPCLVCTCAEVP